MEESVILRSPHPDIHIPEDVSLSDFILSKAVTYGDRPAYIDDVTGQVLTYKQFVDDCNALTASLYQQGLQKGDRVLLCADNCLQFPVIFHAVVKCGGVIAPISDVDLAYSSYVVRNVNPRFAFMQSYNTEARATLDKLLKDCPAFDTLFLIGKPSDQIFSFEELVRKGHDLDFDHPKVNINPVKDSAFISFTSGTTGEKKIALFSHFVPVAEICISIGDPDLGTYNPVVKEVVALNRPMCHPYGRCCYITTGPYCGVTMVLLKDGAIETLLSATQKYKMTIVTGTPLTLSHITKCPTLNAYNIQSMTSILSSGTGLADNVYAAASKLFRINNAYGATEVSFIATASRTNPVNCCKLLPNVQAKIMDTETKKPIKCGDSGEIWIKSPTVFKEYLNNPTATQEAKTADGWYKTGDEGYCDEDHFLHVVDRVKDMLNYDAVKIPPALVEGTLLQHSCVAEVAVVGYPDKVYNELPRAYVVCKPGSTVSEQELQDLVIAENGPLQALRGGVIFVESLPKTALGKVKRKIIRDQLREEYQKSKLS